MLIYLIVCLSILNAISFKGSKILISLYAIELGANPFNIGILVSLYAVFPLLLAVYAGKVSDRFGVRFPMLLGSLGLAFGLLLPYLLPQLLTLYFSPAIIGVAFVFFHISLHNLVGSLGDGHKRTRNFSIFSLGAAVSAFIGPLFVGFSIEHFGHVSTYLFLSLIPILPILILLFFPQIIPKREGKLSNTQKKSVMDLIKDAPLRRTFITSGMVITGIELYTFYFPIYGHTIGLSASMIGIVMSAYAVAAFVVRIVMPTLVRRYEEETVLIYSLFMAGATYLFFPFFENVILLIMISFILGLSLGCGQPLSIILTYNRSPSGRSGEALGMRITVNKFTQVGVPLLFGSLGATFGLFPVFWTSAMFLVTGGYFSRNGKTLKHAT